MYKIGILQDADKDYFSRTLQGGGGGIFRIIPEFWIFGLTFFCTENPCIRHNTWASAQDFSTYGICTWVKVFSIIQEFQWKVSLKILY